MTCLNFTTSYLLSYSTSYDRCHVHAKKQKAKTRRTCEIELANNKKDFFHAYVWVLMLRNFLHFMTCVYKQSFKKFLFHFSTKTQVYAQDLCWWTYCTFSREFGTTSFKLTQHSCVHFTMQLRACRILIVQAEIRLVSNLPNVDSIR